MVIEVFFLVGFLASSDSLDICADSEEVTGANFGAVDSSQGQPMAANVNFENDINDSVISVIMCVM